MRKLALITAILFLTGHVQGIAQDQPKGQTPSGVQSADFGDFSSSTLTTKAWGALAGNDVKMVEIYVNKTVEMYGAKAKEMQASLKEYPYESKEKIHSFWALNDVGTSLYILGLAYQNAGRKDDARKAYKQVVDEYLYAQCWDIKGWFWKPAEAAQQKLAALDS
ncbi:MAG: tetratricopeptide repeat protein [Candidatus Omnitrophica bacterium]|nr:tetratricopeptide repeat protein [Candidatus Omnitrophota bacterium]